MRSNRGTIALAAVLGLAIALPPPARAEGKEAAMLTFMGRASVKIKTQSGLCVYIDPYLGDYSEAADLVLVTHGHSDHNAIGKVTLKPGALVASAPGALPGFKAAVTLKKGEKRDFKGISILTVAAYNKNHGVDSTVGYVLSFDGIVVYHAGDTSKIPEMAELAGLGIDYALFPTDGHWNMGPAEAAECAAIVKARHAIPIHSSPNGPYDEANAKAFAPKGVIRLKPGESAPLERGNAK